MTVTPLQWQQITGPVEQFGRHSGRLVATENPLYVRWQLRSGESFAVGLYGREVQVFHHADASSATYGDVLATADPAKVSPAVIGQIALLLLHSVNNRIHHPLIPREKVPS